MNKHEQLIIEFVLEHTREMAAKKRATYIFALANLCSDDVLIEKFAEVANALDRADELQGKLIEIMRATVPKLGTDGAR